MDRHKREDPRTRRDRVEKRNQGFSLQLEEMTDAYIAWSKAIEDVGLGGDAPMRDKALLQGPYPLRVVDMFGKSSASSLLFFMAYLLQYPMILLLGSMLATREFRRPSFARAWCHAPPSTPHSALPLASLNSIVPASSAAHTLPSNRL